MSIDISDKNIRNREKDFLPPAFSKNGPERAGSHPVELFSRTGRTCYGFQIFIRSKEEEEEEEEEIVVGNPEKDEEPVIVPEAPEMPESEQLELPEVTVEPAQSAEVSMKIETNTASTPILAERIKTAGDLRRSISLNDSFRFSRELFGGSMEQMNHVLQQIGEMHSLDAALVFLSSKIKVEEENEAKADLVELLKKYFI